MAGWGGRGEEWRESGPFDEHQMESVVENRACLLLSVLFIQTRTTTSLNARSHAALTQRVAANLAWRKHGFQLNGRSDAAPRRWEGRAAARGPQDVPPPPKKPRDRLPKEQEDVPTLPSKQLRQWVEC